MKQKFNVMKYAFLVLVLVLACRPKSPEPFPTCVEQATTLADAQRLVAGEWRLAGTAEGSVPRFYANPDLGVRLRITADSIRVSEPGRPVKVVGWTLAKASTGDITFQGTWDTRRERTYLPHPSGYVAVCESSLTLGTCIIDGIYYSYERVR
jgi:hypothetical protein